MKTREQIEKEIAWLEKASHFYLQSRPNDWPGPFIPIVNYLRWVLSDEPEADNG